MRKDALCLSTPKQFGSHISLCPKMRLGNTAASSVFDEKIRLKQNPPVLRPAPFAKGLGDLMTGVAWLTKSCFNLLSMSLIESGQLTGF
ncbi:MAG TPA: hypothetical protein VF452_10155 [Candidatus Binatia bacterium]